MEHIWQQQPPDSNTNVVNVYIKHLRRKIDLPGLAPLLRTIRVVPVFFALRNARPWPSASDVPARLHNLRPLNTSAVGSLVRDSRFTASVCAHVTEAKPGTCFPFRSAPGRR